MAAWMLSSRSVCPACLLVHLGVVAAALTLVPKAWWSGPTVFAVAMIFLSTGGWEKIGTARGTAVFRPRPGESVPQGDVYVLFTDPECGRCRLAEANLAAKPNLQVLHRWVILPHGAYRTMRAAALVESVRLRSPQQARELIRLLASGPEELTDEAILHAASQAGVGPEARTWLTTPPNEAIAALEDDNTTAKELEIQSLPAMAKLSGPDATGSRRLTLLPAAQREN
ncbi:MAG: hypothetical protein JSS65_14235 [Armatimonadetes bacterium]|nr:hypothetical protein [Armatimonadota bacterium]